MQMNNAISELINQLTTKINQPITYCFAECSGINNNLLTSCAMWLGMSHYYDQNHQHWNELIY